MLEQEDENGMPIYAPIPAGRNIGILHNVSGPSDFVDANKPLEGYEVRLGANGNFELTNPSAYGGEFGQEMGRYVDAQEEVMGMEFAVISCFAGPVGEAGEFTSLGLEGGRAGNAGFDFAVGLSEHLQQFADETGSYTYSELTGTDVFVPENFESIANQADNIRFNTQGMNWHEWGHWALHDQGLRTATRYQQGTVTNWELHQLLTNPSWLGKTIFH